MSYGFTTPPPGPNTPVDVHVGDTNDFLQRLRDKAASAVQAGLAERAALGPELLRFVSDARNLRLACDHLLRSGGEAPGPNGQRLQDLTHQELWRMCRSLQAAIRAGRYLPGAERLQKISKGRGRGRRTLTIQNIQDRVVARGIAQVAQLLLDPLFDTHSFGFRPRLDRCHALACAGRLAAEEGRWTILTEDIENAFDNVPLKRLLDVVRKRLPNAESLWQLIETVLTRPAPHKGAKRGLRQGSPLSPLLLNLYLDHVLDRVWRKRVPDIPLLRSADDLLVLCRSEEEALTARTRLRETMSPAGLPLKETDNRTAIRNLNADKAEWLGFLVYRKQDELATQVAESAWESLEERLIQAHQVSASPLRAEQVVQGWIEQIGPTLEHQDQPRTLSRIIQTAGRQAFDELPDMQELETRWKSAHARWRRICLPSRYEYCTDESSAASHGFFVR